MESTLAGSAATVSANLTASSVLPEAVGPTNASGLDAHTQLHGYGFRGGNDAA
jgi:hypothetical protein